MDSPQVSLQNLLVITWILESVRTSSPEVIDLNIPHFNFGILCMGGSPGDVSERPVTQEKRKKGWRMICDVGEATEALEN